MTLVATPAVVLHAFDYLESSRVVRLLTRDAGVVSVLARGARRGGRSGGATSLDLFAEGEARLAVRPTRELQTLAGFDVTAAHTAIGADLDRFTAACMLAELALRLSAGEPNPGMFAAVTGGLASIERECDGAAAIAALAAGWHVVAAAGLGPALDRCAHCDAAIDHGAPAYFSPRAGGTLCGGCVSDHGGGRTLPPAARSAIASWVEGAAGTSRDAADAGNRDTIRAHQRLFREFVTSHLGDERPLRALAAWEHSISPAPG